MTPDSSATTELHMVRQARNRYHPDDSRFASDGHVTFGDMRSVRGFAQEINEKRNLTGDPPEQPIKAGQLNAMALVSEILHYMSHLYREQTDPLAATRAQQWLAERLGREVLDAALRSYVEEFPPLPSITSRSPHRRILTARQTAPQIVTSYLRRC